jgi:hypothetical protein
LPRLEICGRHLPIKISVPAKQGSSHHWKFSNMHTIRDLRMAFNLLYLYDYVAKLCRQQAEVIQNHENEHVCSIGQGEAMHRK